MKKAVISTCCTEESYGSVLQAFALKKVLESLECESQIIKVDTTATEKIVIPPQNFVYRMKMAMAKQYHSLFIRKKAKKREIGCRTFIAEKLDVISYSSNDEVIKNPPDADIYVSGSDQVWNPDLCNKIYFLDFLPPERKRFSYAASMGNTKIQKSKEQEFSRLISLMDSISVREKDMAEIVSQFSNNKVQQHIDPTFLIDAKVWRSLETPYKKIRKPYILVFAIYWDKKYDAEIKQIHKKTGYDIVTIQSGFGSMYSNNRIYDADIGQFIWLIDNAEAIVSTSFHGVAMSIILNKRCIPLIDPNKRSRIDSLLNTLSYPFLSLESICDETSLNYTLINDNILKERKRSIEYLKELLNNE